MVKIHTIQTEDWELDPEKVTGKVLENLKDLGLYRPDLMYRGVAVDEEGLERIEKYGTDRTSEGAADVINSHLEAHYDLEREDIDGEDFSLIKQDELEELASPDYIWALEEGGILKCLTNYAIDTTLDAPLPVLLVYKPESLLYMGERSLEGTPCTEISKFGIDKTNEEGAVYKFEKGTKAIDALVAGFLVKRKWNGYWEEYPDFVY